MTTLNDEQIEAHFRKFSEFFQREVVPDLKFKEGESDADFLFNMGRCFEKLWQEELSFIEMQYWENSGQLDPLL